jgi:ubiquinone/menaquinone biosynthesis C-methylase UbiE
MTEYVDPEADVPTGVDFLNEEHVQKWVAASEVDKPWRIPMRTRFAELLGELPVGSTVLELGSGPGYLAECVLERCPQISAYTLFDFSEWMLALGRERLARFPRARFMNGSFKVAGWTTQLAPPYSAVIAMQSVHEIRHKRHVPGLYRDVHGLLAPGGRLLVCEGQPKDRSPRMTSLHMTADEQLAALSGAGFEKVTLDLMIGSALLVMGKVPTS